MSTDSNPTARPGLADRLSDILDKTGASIKSLVKIALQSRRADIRHDDEAASQRLIIMGNGPSLNEAIASHASMLKKGPAMSVNFAPLAPEFFMLKPKYHIMVDPHFFRSGDDARVGELREKLEQVTWQMAIIVPSGVKFQLDNPNVRVITINTVGAEGWDWLTRKAYDRRIAMPRPRNVLVPAIMAGIWLGYRQIAIVGADHSWLETLSVTNDNRVVTVQPHFYKDSEEEQRRVDAVYATVKLHQLLASFAIAFRSYHQVQRYARQRGVEITNATPGSWIDAFPRLPL